MTLPDPTSDYFTLAGSASSMLRPRFYYRTSLMNDRSVSEMRSPRKTFNRQLLLLPGVALPFLVDPLESINNLAKVRKTV